jgi:hypothetical protein
VIRWWAAGIVLASCSPNHFEQNPPKQFWLFHLSTGRVKALTSGQTPAGQVDAWRDAFHPTGYTIGVINVVPFGGQ